MTNSETQAQYRIEQARHWVRLAQKGGSTTFALSMIEMHLKAADEILAKAEIQPAREAA